VRKPTRQSRRSSRESMRRRRFARVAMGLCGECGQEPLASVTMGQQCLEDTRQRARDWRKQL